MNVWDWEDREYIKCRSWLNRALHDDDDGQDEYDAWLAMCCDLINYMAGWRG